MANFPTLISNCNSQDWSCSFGFISSVASICSVMSFPSVGNLNILWNQFSLTSCQTQKGVPCFINIAYDCSCADLGALQDHLTDLSWEDIFKLTASAAAREFC